MQRRKTVARRKTAGSAAGEALPDDQLVRRILAGELSCFETLVHRHSQRLYRAARAVLADDGEAADVVQESYLRAYRHLEQYAGRAKFSTWLTRIAVHEARARARRIKGKRHESPVESEVIDEAAAAFDPEQRVLSLEAKRILERAVDGLPTPYRTVFVLREVEELSTAETAECLSLTRDAVKTRLHRARVLLRKKLYASVGAMGPQAFRFAGGRCERMWREISGIIRPKRRETRTRVRYAVRTIAAAGATRARGV